MSKFADALRERYIFNDYGLLLRFGEAGRDIAVDYTPRGDGRSMRMTTPSAQDMRDAALALACARRDER